MSQKVRLTVVLVLLVLAVTASIIAARVAISLQVSYASVLASDINGARLSAITSTANLKKTLADLQRHIEDSAASRNPDLLAESVQFKDDFLLNCDLISNKFPDDAEGLSARFLQYYQLATDAGSRLASGQPCEEGSPLLIDMMVACNDTEAALEDLHSRAIRDLREAVDQLAFRRSGTYALALLVSLACSCFSILMAAVALADIWLSKPGHP